MNLTDKLAPALCVAALGLASTAASAANLISNGSFEDPAIGYPYFSAASPTDWTKSGSAGDASIWRVGYADSGGNITVAGEGMQFVTMGGGYLGSGTTTWSQTVSGLTAGGTYQLDFKIAAEGVCCGVQTLSVTFDGSSTASQSFTATTTTGNYWKDWSDAGMSFVADTSSVTVNFTYTGRYDMGLDDVRLAAAVPEPSTYALLLGGLVFVGAVARRRRN